MQEYTFSTHIKINIDANNNNNNNKQYIKLTKISIFK